MLRAPVAPVVEFSEPDMVAAAGTTPTPTPAMVDTARASRVAMDLALSIGAVRKAVHTIAGIPATWPLGLFIDGDQVTDQRAALLDQPEARRTRQWTVTRTLQDLVWHDRAVWLITDRTIYGRVSLVEHIHPHRLDTVTDALDPDRVETWLVDGQPVNERRLIVFDGAGLGGLQRFGAQLLTIYGALQAAAGRYARAPHPHAILKNHGADLTDDEIQALLDSWEAARGTRSVGYLNDVVDYQTMGWNAQELQLTEAREQAALDVARLFALPAFAVDANNGSSMTYANITDQRRDLVDSLQPWTSVITETLSMLDRTGTTAGTVFPRGAQVRFLTEDYTRPSAKTRAETWAALINSGVIDAAEARTLDPLTQGLPDA